MGAEKDLKLQSKSSRPDRVNTYSLTKYSDDDPKKQYMAVWNVGNDNYFSICPAYLDLMIQTIVDGKSNEISFYNSLEDHKLVQQFFHNAYTTIKYGGTDSDQSKFVERKTIAQKTTRFDMVTLKQGKLETHLALFRDCKERRPTYFPPSEDKRYSDSLQEVEDRMTKMISESNKAGAGRGTVNPTRVTN